MCHAKHEYRIVMRDWPKCIIMFYFISNVSIYALPNVNTDEGLSKVYYNVFIIDNDIYLDYLYNMS